MIKRLERNLILFQKEILISLIRTDCGIDVLIAGGDLPHIGAISIVDSDGQIDTKSFEGHKDQFISEVWAKALYEAYRIPVVVSVGIHYDNLDATGIKQIMSEMQKMLNEILHGCINRKQTDEKCAQIP